MKILFIDDNPTIHKIYYEMLKKLNYINNDDEFVVKKSVNELINEEDSFFIDYKIIICDLELGKEQKSGLFFLNSLGKNFKGIKILFTANSTEALGNIMDINTDKILVTKAGPNRPIQSVVNELGKIISEQR